MDFRSLGQQNEQKLLFNFPFLVASRCRSEKVNGAWEGKGKEQGKWGGNKDGDGDKEYDKRGLSTPGKKKC